MDLYIHVFGHYVIDSRLLWYLFVLGKNIDDITQTIY